LRIKEQETHIILHEYDDDDDDDDDDDTIAFCNLVAKNLFFFVAAGR